MTKADIHAGWQTWLLGRAQDDGLSDLERGSLKLELAREVAWAMMTPDSELAAALAARLDKYGDLLTAHDGDLSGFDVWWVQRQAFIVWMAA